MIFLLLPLLQSQRRAEGCNHMDIFFSVMHVLISIGVHVSAGISITLH